MPKVPFTAWLGGPAAIYTSPTGQQDPITQLPYLGTDFQSSYFADLSQADANVWNRQYVPPFTYRGGRYRIVQVASDAVAASLLPNQPVGWATGPTVGSVAFTPGTGYTNGVYNLSSSATGSQTAAVAQVTVSGGAIISVQLVSGGNGFLTTAPPTFSVASLGAGSGGVITAQLTADGGLVTSLTSVAVSTTLIRGISLANPAPTAAQITAGCWIIIQELGIAPVLITTATLTTQGAQVVATAAGNGAVTSQTPAYSAAEIGYALTAPVAGQVIPVDLTITDLPF